MADRGFTIKDLLSVSPKGGKGGAPPPPPFHEANKYKGHTTDEVKIAQSQSQHI